MKTNQQILGQAAASSRIALAAIRASAWENYCAFARTDKLSAMLREQQIILAAEDELLDWPLRSPQEACMI